MKLTKHHKEVFVSAIIKDIPKIDFREEGQTMLNKWAYEDLPAEIKKIKDNPALSHYLNVKQIYYRDLGSIQIVQEKEWGPKTDERLAVIKKAQEDCEAQEAVILEAQNMLKASLAPITTRKALLESFPELASYAPLDTDNILNRAMPALAETVSKLKALGFPKPSTALV